MGLEDDARKELAEQLAREAADAELERKSQEVYAPEWAQEFVSICLREGVPSQQFYVQARTSQPFWSSVRREHFVVQFEGWLVWEHGPDPDGRPSTYPVLAIGKDGRVYPNFRTHHGGKYTPGLPDGESFEATRQYTSVDPEFQLSGARQIAARAIAQVLAGRTAQAGRIITVRPTD